MSLTDISHLTYKPGIIQSPLTNKSYPIIFADDIASGRPCPTVDQYIIENIYPYYSNTHSNATCGIMMKEYVNKSKDIIRKVMNLSDNMKIFFSGNGCTGAVNHLVNKINFLQHSKVVIHTTPFEHHSNFLPWIEKIKDLKSMGKTHLEHRMISNTDLNLNISQYIKDLDTEISSSEKTRLDIFSLIACSNVTGKRYDLQYAELWKWIKDKRINNHHIFMMLDCATMAPYVKLDLNNSDGIYFSGHKFLGGQSTPGILIVNKELIEISHPYEPGGGCVEKADDKCTIYKSDPETREMGGTPNIIGIIRLGYCLMLKESIFDIIHSNESWICKYVADRMNALEVKYPDFKVIGLDNKNMYDLPIYSIVIKDLHYNFITVLFNDLAGIQTRGGISCCGTLGRICKDRMHIDGWCRISFGYLLKESDIMLIFETLEHIIVNGKKYLDKYRYDDKANLYVYGNLI